MPLWRRSCRRSGTADGRRTGSDRRRRLVLPVFGESVSVSRLSSMRWAWSPSPKRAQRLIFQASDQPVPPSPRNSSDWRAAASSSGVSACNLVAGKDAPQMRHVAVACSSGSSLSSSHSCSWPCWPIWFGAIRFRRSRTARRRNSASTPRISDASIVLANRLRMI